MTVSGLLAGFSFAAVIALLAIQNRSKRFEVAFIGFLLSTFLFIVSTLGSWAVLEWIAEHENDKYESKVFFAGTYIGLVFGLLAFVVGVVGTAFLHSNLAGIISIIAGLGIVAFFFASAVASARD